MDIYAYRYPGGELLFASEAKALLAALDTSPHADREAVLEYLVAPCFSGVAHGAFEGVEHLQPGNLLRVDRSGIEVRSWWDYDNTAPADESPENLVGEVRQRLTDAVRRSLRV